MHPVGFGHSDVGRQREGNEDCMHVDDATGLYVVADGMGGHAAGEVASQAAIETLVAELTDRRELLARYRRGEASGEALLAVVRDAVQKACMHVHELANADEDRAGMGCTLTSLLVLGSKAAMAHVGDSRLYLLRAGKLSQLTTDHTMANELCLAGLIAPEEVRDHQYAHVLTRAIGTQASVVPDLLMLDIVPGDRFLLCSDGLADHIEHEAELGAAITDHALAEIPGALVDFANDNGGHDNVTVIAIEVEPDDPEIQIVDDMSNEVHSKFEALQAVFLFDGLTVALLTRVLNACDVVEYDPGDAVIRAGEPCAQLCIVLEGKFALDGADRRELRPGDHVGATTLLAPRPARATLTAKEMARLLVLKRDPFWALVKSRPWLGVGLLERLGRHAGTNVPVEQRDAL